MKRRISWGTFDNYEQDQPQLSDSQRNVEVVNNPQYNNTDFQQELIVTRTPKKQSDKKLKENLPSQNSNQQNQNQQRIKRISFMPYFKVQFLEEIRESDESTLSSHNRRQSNQTLNLLPIKCTPKQFSASKSAQILKMTHTPKTASKQQQPTINNDPAITLQEIIDKLEQLPQITSPIEDDQINLIIERLNALIESKQMQVDQLQDDFDLLVKTYNPEVIQSDEEKEVELSSESLRVGVIDALGYCVNDIKFVGNKYHVSVRYYKIKLMLCLEISVDRRHTKPQTLSLNSSFMLDLQASKIQLTDACVEQLSFFDQSGPNFSPLESLNDLIRFEIDRPTSHQSISQLINSLPLKFIDLCNIKDIILQCEHYFGSKISYHDCRLCLFTGYRFNLNDRLRREENYNNESDFVIMIELDMKNSMKVFMYMKQMTQHKIEKLVRCPDQMFELFTTSEWETDRSKMISQNTNIQNKIKDIWHNKAPQEMFQMICQMQELSLVV